MNKGYPLIDHILSSSSKHYELLELLKCIEHKLSSVYNYSSIRDVKIRDSVISKVMHLTDDIRVIIDILNKLD
jgi:hypothetical protein